MTITSTSNTLTDANHAAALGKLLYESAVFQGVSTAAHAAVKILTGMEVGVGPIRAMSSLHVIKGKIVMDAQLMATLIVRSDHYTYQVKQHDETQCKIDFFRDGKLIGTSAFTIEDGRKAGLTRSPNWPTFPRDMLFAGAISNGARWYCPDVFGGAVYTPEELDAVADDDAGQDDDEIIDAEFKVVCSTESQDSAVLLAALIREADTSLEQFLEHYKVGTLGELTAGQLLEAITALVDRKNKN